MYVDGYKGFSESDWYGAYFENAARDGAAGAMFWILTPDSQRGYSVTYSSSRDSSILTAITGGAHLFSSLSNALPAPALLDSGRHLVPRQFAFSRSEAEPA